MFVTRSDKTCFADGMIRDSFPVRSRGSCDYGLVFDALAHNAGILYPDIQADKREAAR